MITINKYNNGKMNDYKNIFIYCILYTQWRTLGEGVKCPL